jgi:rare lipoprotein A
VATRQRVWITGGLATALLALALAGCSSKPPNTARSPDDGRGSYKIGKPYTVDGITYYPAEDLSYSETGIASWYGPGFHGRNTASGEVYDQEQVSAAHKTLPMPSIVRVTNLDNGKSVIARVNDRGPFVSGRIIDMSKGGARQLGLDISGTAHVKVEIMRRESEIVKQVALSGGGVSDQMAALSNPPPVLDATPAGTMIAGSGDRGYTSQALAPPSTAPAAASASQPVQPVVGASQPIWSPGDPPPKVPMVMADSSPAPQAVLPAPQPPIAQPVAQAPLPSTQVASTQVASTQVASAPVAPIQPPAAPPPPVVQASWSPQELGQNGSTVPVQPAQLAPAPSTLGKQSVMLRAAPPPAPGASSPVPTGGGQIYVQAGAFSQLDNAERARLQLGRFGSTLVSPVQANGRELYRVRLGPIASPEAADAIRLRVLQAGYHDARVISD